MTQNGSNLRIIISEQCSIYWTISFHGNEIPEAEITVLLCSTIRRVSSFLIGKIVVLIFQHFGIRKKQLKPYTNQYFYLCWYDKRSKGRIFTRPSFLWYMYTRLFQF